MPPPAWPGPPSGPPVCVRHPDRPTGLACTRCGRPACTDCLREAAVGHQCVDCVAAARGAARRARSLPRSGGPARRAGRPVVVWSLVALNVLLYVLTAAQARDPLNNTGSPLWKAWALVPADVAAGDWWRLVTAGFLHIGPIHIASNMFALWVLGRDLELVLGRARFLGLYLVSLLGGAVAVVLFSPADEYVAGASGAVFGLMGGLLLVLVRLRRPLGQVIALIVLNLVLSEVIPNISIAGHIGGLVVGALATAVIVYAPPRRRTAVQAGGLAGITVLLVGVLAVGIPLVLG